MATGSSETIAKHAEAIIKNAEKILEATQSGIIISEDNVTEGTTEQAVGNLIASLTT